MTKEKRRVSLNVKLTLVIALSFVLSIIAVFLANWIGNVIIEHKFLSEHAVQTTMDKVYSELEEYIDDYQVSGNDTRALKKWLADRSDTYLYVYDNLNVYFSGGWNMTDNGSSTDDYMNSASTSSYGEITDSNKKVRRIEEDDYQGDARNRIVQFADDKYYVYIDTYKEHKAYIALNTSCGIIAFIIFFTVFLSYSRAVMRRIGLIIEKTKQISDGRLDIEIEDNSNDEIRTLADSIDAMKNSIVMRQENERAAWNANTELITSMSHDIKTPLTSIIGYLDILESEKNLPEGERKKYLKACHDKAVQLADMSNKLFQYFLVFSKDHMPKELEIYDAGILIDQVLSEHCAELITNGFDIDYKYEVPDVSIETDIASLLRVFDNVFSNIQKYAEAGKPVSVHSYQYKDTDYIVTEISNTVSVESRKTESTKIGLKTCEKLCNNLKGNFTYEIEGGIFTAKIVMPIIQEKTYSA